MTDRRTCPWYVTAHAVRAWQAICREAPRSFDDASDRLIEICADIWHDRYASGERLPKVTRTGAYVYAAGHTYGKMQLIVSAARRAEGEKQQVVDVIPRSTARRRRYDATR